MFTLVRFALGLYAWFHRRARNFDAHARVGRVRIFVARDAYTRATFGSCVGYTIGTDVYARSQRALTPTLIAHELKHVEQFERGGLRFLIDYRRETRRRGYYNNKYERAARRAESHVAACVVSRRSAARR